MWKIAIASFLCMPTAFAGVDAQFPEGALGVSWGATLQQVQAAYPEGLTWPVKGEFDGVAYAVPGTSQMLGWRTPVKLVQFLFTKDNSLRTIFLHFAYSDRDSALYDVAELLGQDYSIKDEAAARKFRWEPGTNTVAQFEIGSSALQPWANLGIQARNVTK